MTLFKICILDNSALPNPPFPHAIPVELFGIATCPVPFTPIQFPWIVILFALHITPTPCHDTPV